MLVRNLDRTVAHFKQRGGKAKLAKVDTCCSEFTDLYNDGVIVFVTRWEKGHEHLWENLQEKYAVIIYHPTADDKDYLYFSYCPFCGGKVKIVEDK